MPAYHSALNDLSVKEVCGCSILPIKTKTRGPAPPCPDDQEDIVDEILDFFRANVLFTNYEINGNADRVLVYGTLFVHACLKKMDYGQSKEQGTFKRNYYVSVFMMVSGSSVASNGGGYVQCTWGFRVSFGWHGQSTQDGR